MQPSQPPTVLIADDNALARGLLAGILRKVGISDVQMAATGLEAVDIYREKRPDIVFLDIQMPEKNGLVALKEIKELNAKAYVVIVSGFSSADNVKTAIHAGANGFLVKPYRPDRINGVLKGYQAAAG